MTNPRVGIRLGPELPSRQREQLSTDQELPLQWPNWAEGFEEVTAPPGRGQSPPESSVVVPRRVCDWPRGRCWSYHAGLVGQRGLSTRGEGQDTMGSARAGWAPGQPQAGPPVTKGITLSTSICLCPAAHRTLTLGWLVLAMQAVGPQSWELPSCWWCLILSGCWMGCAQSWALHHWQ